MIMKIKYMARLEDDPTSDLGVFEQTFNSIAEMECWEEDFEDANPGQVLHKISAEIDRA